MNPSDQPEHGHEMARALPVGPRRPHTPRGSAAAHRSLTLPAAADTGTVVALSAKKVADTPMLQVLHIATVVEDQRMARHGGPIRGNAQRGKNAVSYEIGSGQPYKVSCSLPPEVAEKVVAAARGMNGSVAGLVVAALARMEVDENGVPVWYQPPDELQEKLIA